jgi:hypothetical protein
MEMGLVMPQMFHHVMLQMVVGLASAQRRICFQVIILIS